MRRGRGEIAPSPPNEPAVADVGVKPSKFKSAVQKIGAALNKPRKQFTANAKRFKARGSY